MTYDVEQKEDVGTVLVVDDDSRVLHQLKWGLCSHYTVMTAENSEQAMALARKESPDLVTLDLALERGDAESGFSLLERLLVLDPTIKVVLITGNDARENARRAVERGAYDFFPKPVDIDELRFLLGRALTVRRLEIENAALARRVSQGAALGNMLGQSHEMNEVFDLVRKVAPTSVTALITGDSGTGKELVAREIHRLSKRHDKPCATISCAAIPENLLESELFGHEKGSFTGAHMSRAGKLENADGGTVVLDEIGEMPLGLQSKILRFLQEREIERIGGRKIIPLDVRIIAATNRNLMEEVKKGRFREDLYYRLSVVNIHLPRLSERGPDIVILAIKFLERFSAEFERKKLAFSQDALSAMQSHDWPGNVRELEHRVKRGVLLSSGRTVKAEDLELERTKGRMLPLRAARKEADRHIVVDALRKSHGNVSKAARTLEVSRPTFHDLLKKLEVNPDEFRAAYAGSSRKHDTGGGE